MSAEDARIRTVRPGVVRALALIVCIGSLPGLIVSSIADSTEAALAFGVAMAAGALVLVVVSAIAAGGTGSGDDGEEIEARIARLVDAGADEAAVRDLTRTAISYGETRSQR